MPKTKQLPSIVNWLKESWEATKTTWKSILSIYAIYFAIFITLGLVIALIFAMTVGLSVFVGLENPSTIISSLGTIGLSIIALIVPAMYLQAAVNSTVILAVTETKKNLRVGKLMNMGFKKAWPVVAVGLLMWFLIIGSLGLFIIPGIIVSIFLSFSMFEVVVGNKKPLDSLKSSYEMFSQNFWEVLIRMIVMMGVAILASLFMALLGGDTPSGLFMLISMILNIALGIYITVAVVKLYQQVKAITVKKKTEITWIWVVAIIGWLLGLLFAKTMFSAAKFLGKNVDYTSVIEQSLSEEDKLEMREFQALMEAYGYDSDADFSTMTEEEVEEMMGEMMKNVKVDFQEGDEGSFKVEVNY